MINFRPNLEGEIQIAGVGSPPTGWSSLVGGVVFKTFFEFLVLKIYVRKKSQFCQYSLLRLKNYPSASILRFFSGVVSSPSRLFKTFSLFSIFSRFFFGFSLFWLNWNTALKATLDGGWRHQGDRSLAEATNNAPNSGKQQHGFHWLSGPSDIWTWKKSRFENREYRPKYWPKRTVSGPFSVEVLSIKKVQTSPNFHTWSQA